MSTPGARLRQGREELWNNVKVGAPEECWLWEGRHSSGYGYMKTGHTTAHRIAYMVWVGEIPPDYTIDHLCRNRLCVNPFHLEAVTAVENVMRGDGFTAVNARKTHCIRGHPFSSKNTQWVISRRGERTWRRCRECRNVRRRMRAKEAAVA